MLVFNGAGATRTSAAFSRSTIALWNTPQRVGRIVKQPRTRLGALLAAERISNGPSDSSFDIRERPEHALPKFEITEPRFLRVDLPGRAHDPIAIRQRRVVQARVCLQRGEILCPDLLDFPVLL